MRKISELDNNASTNTDANESSNNRQISQSLPVDCIQEILSNLSTLEMSQAGLVAKSWYLAASKAITRKIREICGGRSPDELYELLKCNNLSELNQFLTFAKENVEELHAPHAPRLVAVIPAAFAEFFKSSSEALTIFKEITEDLDREQTYLIFSIALSAQVLLAAFKEGIHLSDNDIEEEFLWQFTEGRSFCDVSITKKLAAQIGTEREKFLTSINPTLR